MQRLLCDGGTAVAIELDPAALIGGRRAAPGGLGERRRSYLQEQGPEAAACAEQLMALLHPLGRVGRGEEGAAVAYLLFADASFLTGAIIPVDGGCEP